MTWGLMFLVIFVVWAALEFVYFPLRSEQSDNGLLGDHEPYPLDD